MRENNVDGFISIVKDPSVDLSDSEKDSFILYSEGDSKNNIFPPIGFGIKSREGKFIVTRRYEIFKEERPFDDLESAVEGLYEFINETAEKTRDVYKAKEGLSYIIIGEIKDFGTMGVGEIYLSSPSLTSFN